MKTIYLIRHAKSSWKDVTKTDFERTLNKRGLHDSPNIANELKKNDFNTDLVLCSPSKRTRKTLKIINKTLQIDETKINFIDTIYESSTQNLLDIINNIPPSVNNVTIIGHNPSITSLSNYLTGNYISNIPTCGVVKIDIEVDDWNEIIGGLGLQKLFIYPKML